MGLSHWQLRRRVTTRRNTYTGPVNAMLCAKAKAYGRGGEPSYGDLSLTLTLPSGLWQKDVLEMISPNRKWSVPAIQNPVVGNILEAANLLMNIKPDHVRTHTGRVYSTYRVA